VCFKKAPCHDDSETGAFFGKQTTITYDFLGSEINTFCILSDGASAFFYRGSGAILLHQHRAWLIGITLAQGGGGHIYPNLDARTALRSSKMDCPVVDESSEEEREVLSLHFERRTILICLSDLFSMDSKQAPSSDVFFCFLYGLYTWAHLRDMLSELLVGAAVV
jgi:hypothetical protein